MRTTQAVTQADCIVSTSRWRLRILHPPSVAALLAVLLPVLDASAQTPVTEVSSAQDLATLETQLRAVESQWTAAQQELLATFGQANQTLVERIARIDQWKAEHRVVLEKVEKLNQQIGEKKAEIAASVPQPPLQPIPNEPLLNEIAAIHAAIFAGTAPVREFKLSPVDRIAWIDEFKRINQPLFQQLAEKEQTVSERNAESAALLPIPPAALPGLTPAEQSRANQAALKLREIFEEANTLSLVDRISALDAASKEIKASLAELETLQAKQSSK